MLINPEDCAASTYESLNVRALLPSMPPALLVVPKALRNALGIGRRTQLEAEAREGVSELAAADAAARVEHRDGIPVIASDDAPLTADEFAPRSGPRTVVQSDSLDAAG